jgi:hypothetical protein
VIEALDLLRGVLRDRIQQSAGFQQPAAIAGTQSKGIRALARRRRGVHDQVEAGFACHGVAELDHLPELERRVDMQQRERRTGRPESFLCQAQKYRRILPDGIEQRGTGKFSGYFPEDIDAFFFKRRQIRLRVIQRSTFYRIRAVASC